LRFGANYRSRISHDLSGPENVSVPQSLSVLSPMNAAQLDVSNGGTHTQVTLPDTASLGAYWQVEPDLALLAEIEWTHWSLFHNLITTSDSMAAPSSNVLENWRNTWFGSVGANWQLLDVLTLQSGLAFDETPIPSAQYRYAAIPDTNRVIVGVGFTYAMLQGLDMQFGYGHIFGLPGGVQSSAYASAGTLSGKVHNSGDTASMGVRAKF
jgi:long-chain fatty acid transport protein